MNEIKLKYGCNSNQVPSKIYMPVSNQKLPLKVLNGTPSYINILDALNGWQLVRELKKATSFPAATSFKHFSPAGVALGTEMSSDLKKVCAIYDLANITSKIAMAYAKARGADRLSSYGDFVALSDECDEQTAIILKREVSDGIIAPSFSKDALEILKTKKHNAYVIIQIDEQYEPKELEHREVFGIVFEQRRNDIEINKNIFKRIVTKNNKLNEQALRNLIIATTTVKYTQSNSICFAFDDMAVGIGAGQQSRIDCTKIAGTKANAFFLRRHPKILNLPFLKNLKRPDIDNITNEIVRNFKTEPFNLENWSKYFTKKATMLTTDDYDNWIKNFDGICLASDGFFPFADNIEAAAKFNTKFISQPGGSIRDNEIIDACNKHGITMSITDKRLFLH